MSRTLMRGQRGDDVAAVQDLLRAAGFDPGVSDGSFGATTELAVRAFQRARGLVADGAVGPVTLAALKAAGPGSGPAPVPRGISLHVGINVVDPLKYPMPVPPLRGCENDARAMHKIATAQGFDATMLLGQAATADAVAAGITDAAAVLTDGDFFLLTFATHGSQIRDLNGDDSGELDETVVAFDRQVLDDELYALFTTFVAGVRVLVISDTCHSGTVTREMDMAYRALAAVLEDSDHGFTERGVVYLPAGGRRSIGGDLRSALAEVMPAVADATDPTRAIGSDATARAARLTDLAWGAASNWLRELDQVDLSTAPQNRMLPPEVQQADLAARRDLYRAKAQAAAATRTLGPAADVLLLAACAEGQVALDGQANGLFTQRLLEVLATGAAGTYPDLHHRILQLMPPPQTPQLYWATERNTGFENQRPLVIDATRELATDRPGTRRPAGRGVRIPAGRVPAA